MTYRVIKIIPYLLIFFVAGIVLNETLLVDQTHIIYGGDLLTQFYFWKGFLFDSLKLGSIPFWNPYLFSGTPFLSHPSTAAFYPLTYLGLILPFSNSFSWLYFIHLCIAGTGMYYFSRNYCDKASSIIASLIFVLSGYFAARIYAGHIDLFTTAVWIPWVFASFIRKKYLVAVFSLSLLILAGYNAYLVFTVEFLVIYTTFNILRRKKNARSNILWLLFVCILALFLTAISWIPTYQVAKNSIRRNGLPYDTASWGSLPISGLKLFVSPLDRAELNKISFNLGGGPKDNPFDHFIGIGSVVTLIFGIVLNLLLHLGIFKKVKKTHSDFWIFTGVCLFMLWISFGYFAPVNLHKILYEVIPLYRMMRIPLQHLILVVVLVPVMVGMTISRIYIVPRILLGFVIILELFLWGKPYIFSTSIPDVNYDQQLSWILSKTTIGQRTLPNYRVVSPVLSDMDLNTPLKYNLFSTSGYDPVILDRYYTFIQNASNYSETSLINYNVEIPPMILRPDLLRLLGVSNVIVERGAELEIPSEYKTVHSSQRYDLLQNDGSSKLYFLTDSVISFNTSEEVLEKIKSNTIDISKNILINLDHKNNAMPKLSKCLVPNIKNKITLTKYINNSYTFESDTSCDHYLGTSIPYYPGWETFIDGKSVVTHLIDATFDGLYLPQGIHTVEIKYNPVIYYITGLISLVGVLGLVGWIYYDRKS